MSRILNFTKEMRVLAPRPEPIVRTLAPFLTQLRPLVMQAVFANGVPTYETKLNELVQTVLASPAVCHEEIMRLLTKMNAMVRSAKTPRATRISVYILLHQFCHAEAAPQSA